MYIRQTLTNILVARENSKKSLLTGWDGSLTDQAFIIPKTLEI